MKGTKDKDKEERTTIHLVRPEGGEDEEPVRWPGWQGAPSWAAGGGALIFGENGSHFPIDASCQLHRFDLNSRATTDLPGTAGLWTARASPTGRYVAAETRDSRDLVLYDIESRRVSKLLSFKDSLVGDNPTWSRDGRFLYIDAPESKDPTIYRIRIADRRIERVASLRGIPRAQVGYWLGLTPNDAPLITRLLDGSEIFAWDWVIR